MVFSSSKTLLVTLVDVSHLDAAKQLFASAYFNGEFNGDFMILLHGSSDGMNQQELSWFTDHNILVKYCAPISHQVFAKYSSIYASYFYLFLSELRQWSNIVFLDVDCVVRSSIKNLTTLSGIYTRSYYNFEPTTVIDGVKLTPKNFFNPGVMVFSNDILIDSLFDELVSYHQKLCKIFSAERYGGEFAERALALCFGTTFKELPACYNVIPNQFREYLGFSHQEIDGVIIHHATGKFYPKPWDSRSPFYDEWMSNYNRSNKFRDKTAKTASVTWPLRQIVQLDKLVTRRMRRARRLYYTAYFDSIAGRVGNKVNFFLPSLHQPLKNLYEYFRDKLN